MGIRFPLLLHCYFVEGFCLDCAGNGMIRLIVIAFVIYLAIGACFALPFAFAWVRRLDPVASDSSIGFRLLCIPGAVLLWPVLILKMRNA